MKKQYTLKSVETGKEYAEEKAYAYEPKTGAALDVIYDYDAISARLNIEVLKTAPLKAVKYLDFYPLSDLRKIVSLDEGGTPLYRCANLGKKLGMKNLYIKHEGLNPTGAFKDRGTMIEITKAVEMGKKAVICASTGNMAASVSAYAAKAGLPCYILAPEGTALGKMSQTLAYGARLIQIRGTYDECARLAVEISEKNNFFLAGDYAFRMEGQKSQGFEIVEQLGWKSPDKVIVPVGCGTNMSAIWKGFKEFHHFGLTDSLPQMVAVQASGASPVIDAFSKKKRKWDVVDKPQTIASAIQIGDPLDGVKVLDALRSSKGHGVSVSDEEILEAEKMLAREESVFVEPSAAATLAALLRMLKEKKVSKDETVVLLLAGIGLKDPLSALKVLPSPPSVEPDYDEIKQFLNYGSYTVQSATKGKEKLFERIPTVPTLKKILKERFEVILSKEDLDAFREQIALVLEKGKTVMVSDAKLIIQNILKREHIKKKALIVEEFTVTGSKHNQAEASVQVTFNGKRVTAKGKGVGPVDAAIKAIKKTIQNGFRFHLVDYHVDIDSKGTDSVVDVRMTLQDEHKNQVIALGTSPDVVAASIDAYERGYNLLYAKNN